MDLPVIGAHCELEHCGSLDLLPIRCTGCQRLFCRHHVALSSHSCVSLEQNHSSLEALKDTTPTSRRERCSFAGCQRVTLESVIVDKTKPEDRVVATCPNCVKAYCAVHRHPSDHACTRVPLPSSSTEKNPEAHALLKKNFPARSSSHVVVNKTPPSSTEPKKLARLRAVELMKMRHHAMPADPKDKSASVPLSNRIHLKVIPPSATPSAGQVFWLRKTVVTGKALDLIADRLSVPITDVLSAYLDHQPVDDGPSRRLINDKLLSEQIEDGDTVYFIDGTS